MPIPSVKTEAPLIEPSQDEARQRRSVSHGRSNVLKAGSVLQNRYRVLEVLGVGGMSTVYRARDLKFTSVDRLCAVKEMFNAGEDPKLKQMRLANFQREAALLATLTHSAIPRIYDYFEQQGTIYLVLELIHGQDLESILSQRGEPFDEKTIIDWAIRLCSVLIYLHGQQPEPIIFRDLKPSNIMIRTEDEALMLVDFGIARSFAPQQKGTMIGTEGYAPPEQYKGIADARGDIYALGATLHHLATGNDPRSETPFTFAQRPPRKLNRMLTERFEAIILKCVEYKPEDRFQTVRELGEALASIQVGSAPLPRPSEPVRVVAVEATQRPREAGSRTLDAAQRQRSEGSRSLEGAMPAAPAPAAAPAAVNVPDDRLAWSLKTSDEVRGSATIAGGAIYVGSYDGHLYAIDETDGSVRWRFHTQKGIVSRPSVIAEMVIVGSEDKSVYAISRQSGRAIWSYRTDMPIRSSPWVDERSCVIGSDDGFLYHLDRQKGVVTWRYKTWGPIRSSPALAGDGLVFGSDDGYLYRVNRETGQLAWRQHIGAPVMSSPAIEGQTIVFGASDGMIRGVGVRDGKQIWAQQTAKTVIASPAIDNGIAYTGSADGHMYATQITTGSLVWKAQVCRQITSSATLDGDKLYVGGNDAAFYCLNPASGAVSWRFGTSGAVVAKPLLTPEHIVFGSLDGTIYALHRR